MRNEQRWFLFLGKTERTGTDSPPISIFSASAEEQFPLQADPGRMNWIATLRCLHQEQHLVPVCTADRAGCCVGGELAGTAPLAHCWLPGPAIFTSPELGKCEHQLPAGVSWHRNPSERSSEPEGTGGGEVGEILLRALRLHTSPALRRLWSSPVDLGIPGEAGEEQGAPAPWP